MPRRLPGLVRNLTGGSLASVAYGEVGSSIYFALGIVALFALGLTPWVLLAVGALFIARLALVCGGHHGDPRDGRRRHAGPPRFQRPDRLPDRLGAAPRLRDRDRARCALRAALLRPRGGLGAADPAPVGRRRRRLHHSDDHGPAADPPAGPVPDRGRRRRRGVRHPGAADRPRLRLPLLVPRPQQRRRPRHRPDLEPPRVRAAAGDARLHRPGDCREPRPGGSRAGQDDPARPFWRARCGRDRLRPDRDRRNRGVPRHERPHRARHRLGAGAAGRDRRGARRPAARLPGRLPAGS